MTNAFTPPSHTVFARPRRAALSPRRAPKRWVRVAATVAVGPGGAEGAVVDVGSRFWEWEGNGKVHYRVAGTRGPAVLFVPGFGVGAFHFEQNVAELARSGHRVYALDKIGLGRSTVLDGGVAARVSAELWKEQIVAFIDEVLGGEAVFLAGNSLGGLLAASVASERSDLVRGAVLLNAAPFWVSVPEKAPPMFRRMLSTMLDRFWLNLTDESTVKRTLSLVYSCKDRVTDALVQDILEPTQREWAREVFRSVLLAPQLATGFEDSVRDAFLDKNIPLAIINGASDPWVGPVFGMRLKTLVPDSTLYELSPCGHCAHSEAAGAVNSIIEGWVSAVVTGTEHPTFGRDESPMNVEGVDIITRDGVPRSLVDRLASVDNLVVVFLIAAWSTLTRFPEIVSIAER